MISASLMAATVWKSSLRLPLWPDPNRDFLAVILLVFGRPIHRPGKPLSIVTETRLLGASGEVQSAGAFLALDKLYDPKKQNKNDMKCQQKTSVLRCNKAMCPDAEDFLVTASGISWNAFGSFCPITESCFNGRFLVFWDRATKQ